MEALSVGLQEWAVVCSGLGDGRLMLILRKGGIHERGGGLFSPEHPRFALLPSYLHQSSDRVATGMRGDVQGTRLPPEPGSIRISHWAEAVRTWDCRDLMSLQSLEAESPYTPAEIATRFAYRDEPRLFAVALRVYRLPVPVLIPDDPAYAGCRSWITLRAPLAPTGSIPVLASGFFEARLERISTLLHRAHLTPP